MKTKVISAIAGLLVLAACGGSSTTSATLESLQEEAGRLDTVYGTDIQNRNFTPLADLPMSTTVNYRGVIGIGPASYLPGGEIAVGNMTANVNFSDNTISGGANSFFDSEDGTPLSGSLALVASIDRSVGITAENSIIGTLSGNLADTGNNADINLVIHGSLLRSDYRALHGYADGTAQFSNQAGPTFIEAEFGLERQ